jgi:hypothetical protein
MQDAIEARGAFAFVYGRACSANPFKEGTDAHLVWNIGWLENENSEAMRRHNERCATFGALTG